MSEKVRRRDIHLRDEYGEETFLVVTVKHPLRIHKDQGKRREPIVVVGPEESEDERQHRVRVNSERPTRRLLPEQMNGHIPDIVPIGNSPHMVDLIPGVESQVLTRFANPVISPEGNLIRKGSEIRVRYNARLEPQAPRRP